MSVFGVSETTTNMKTYSSMCEIEFIHQGLINIKKLSFTSRQHIVAYRVGGSVLVDSPLQGRNRNGVPLSLSQGGGGTLEIVIKCGTRHNMQYPVPIVASSAALGGGAASPARNNGNGLVPVVMQQPVLYLASASLDNAGHEKSAGRQHLLVGASSCTRQ